MTLLVSALIVGVFLGTIYGLMAFGMVASYRISRVVNLGQAGVAAFGATVYWWMTSQWGAPVAVSIVGAIVVGAVLGSLMGWVSLLMRRFPPSFMMIFSLCVTLLLFALVDRMLPPQQVAPALARPRVVHPPAQPPRLGAADRGQRPGRGVAGI